MSATSKPLTAPLSETFPAKRKRGRPRKDGDIPRNGSSQSTIAPRPESIQKVQKYEFNVKEASVSNMTGQNVYGVIQGSFDAGYFISVRIGNHATPLRGVVFLPGKFTPITAANDVAPHAKVYQRAEMTKPDMDEQNRVNEPKMMAVSGMEDLKQPSSSSHPTLPSNTPPIIPRTSSSSSLGSKFSITENHEIGLEKRPHSTPPLENLRMVEQDDVMQVFEVSIPPEQHKATDTEAVKDVSQSLSTATASNLLGEHTRSLDLPQIVVQGKPQPLLSTIHPFSEMQGINQENQQPPSSASYVSFPLASQTLKSGLHYRPLDHNERQGSLFQLHETPVVAQLRAMESKLQPTDLFQNELKCSNLKLHQGHFEDQSQTAGFKDPNLVPHQTLISSNPHLLHLQLMNQQLEFTTEKSNFPPQIIAIKETNFPPQTIAIKETNFEPDAKIARKSENCCGREVGYVTSNAETSSLSAPRTRDDNMPLKLELGGSTLGRGFYGEASTSAGCTTDMDFVLSGLVQHKEPHNGLGIQPP